MANQKTIRLGPWSGTGGHAWDYNPGIDTAIIEIVIKHAEVVDSISFTSINHATGEIMTSGTFGGTGGTSTTVSIDGREEYLTSISGTVIDYLGNGNRIVQSLTIHTNKKTYGPYGDVHGSPFEIPMRDGEIVGFFGRAGIYVDAIGIRVKPSAN